MFLVKYRDCSLKQTGKSGSPLNFNPYLDVVVESFGTKRIMYGSDWPVCLVASGYDEMLGIVKKYFSTFSVNEQETVLRWQCNAIL